MTQLVHSHLVPGSSPALSVSCIKHSLPLTLDETLCYEDLPHIAFDILDLRKPRVHNTLPREDGAELERAEPRLPSDLHDQKPPESRR